MFCSTAERDCRLSTIPRATDRRKGDRTFGVDSLWFRCSHNFFSHTNPSETLQRVTPPSKTMSFSPPCFDDSTSRPQDESRDRESNSSFEKSNTDDAGTTLSDSQYLDDSLADNITKRDKFYHPSRDLPMDILIAAFGSEEEAQAYKCGHDGMVSPSLYQKDSFDDLPGYYEDQPENYPLVDYSAEVTDQEGEFRHLSIGYLTEMLGSREAAREYKYGPNRRALTAEEEACGFDRDLRDVIPHFDDWKKLPEDVIIEKYGMDSKELLRWCEGIETLWNESQRWHETNIDIAMQIDELIENIDSLASDVARLRENYY